MGGSSYWEALASINATFAEDIETHVYYDDVTLEEQRALEQLVRDLKHIAARAREFERMRMRQDGAEAYATLRVIVNGPARGSER